MILPETAGTGSDVAYHRSAFVRIFGSRLQLVSADDLEVRVDEDVVWPVDADGVDLVLTVAQLHDTVDDPPGIGGQSSFVALAALAPPAIAPDLCLGRAIARIMMKYSALCLISGEWQTKRRSDLPPRLSTTTDTDLAIPKACSTTSSSPPVSHRAT